MVENWKQWDNFRKANQIFFFIMIISVAIITIWGIKVICEFKAGEQFEKAWDKIVDDKNKKEYIEWIWECPEFVTAHYNCDLDKQFENITGLYCGDKLVCENKYVIREYKPVQQEIEEAL